MCRQRQRTRLPMFRWLVLSLVLLPLVAATSAVAARDRDRDRLPDRWERRHHLSTSEKSAAGDPDRDGLRNRREYRLRTNPRRRDTDRDGLRDGAEVRRHHTNPRRKDTDRDGLRDRAEIRRHHTNPRKRDTDGDGHGDGAEIRAGTDPRDPASHPSGNPSGPGSPTAPGGTATPGPSPSQAGFPDVGSTGVPPGTTLTAYTGPSTVTTPGAVIDGKRLGCIAIKAENVTIRNSLIECAGGWAITHNDDGARGNPLLVVDSEIDCTASQGQIGIGEADYTLRRVEIRNCGDGCEINRDVLVEDSLIHAMDNGGSDPHSDNCQFGWGHFEGNNLIGGVLNVTFRHNTLYAIDNTGRSADKTITRNGGSNVDTDVLIENNLLAGGGYTLHCFDGTANNEIVRNNRFSTRFFPKVGVYGHSDGCRQEDAGGNVIHETGQPITLH